MTVVAGIAIDADDFDIGDVLSATTTRIDLTQFVPVEGQLVPYFWKERGGDRATFERAVRGDPRVESLTTLDGRANAHLYRIDWAEPVDGFVGALYDHDVMVEEGGTDDGTRWQFRLRAMTQAELSSFQRACAERGIHLDVRYVTQTPDSQRGRAERLSDEQHEALLLALENGYFDIPRGNSQSELAEQVGISRQSFARRLRRAERNVLETVFWDELEGK
jgi:predicted DNA binding protein